jgi:hypothetical protein
LRTARRNFPVTNESTREIDRLCARLEQAEAEVERLKAKLANPWIPVTERLPDDEQYVDIWASRDNGTGYRHTEVLFLALDGPGPVLWTGHWLDPESRITHWMPMPEAPR